MGRQTASLSSVCAAFQPKYDQADRKPHIPTRKFDLLFRRFLLEKTVTRIWEPERDFHFAKEKKGPDI